MISIRNTPRLAAGQLWHRGAFVYALLMLSVIGGLAGCSGSSDSATVSGVVTMDDKPVGAGVSVVFGHKVNNIIAYGTTSSDGRFELVTSKSKSKTSRVPSGTYSVTCSKQYSVDVGGKDGDSPDQFDGVIPERYGRAATSNLSLEVKPGANDLQVKLYSKEQ